MQNSLIWETQQRQGSRLGSRLRKSCAFPRNALLHGSAVISEETLGPCEEMEHLLGTWQMVPHRLCSQMGQGEEWYSASLLQGRSEIPADRKEVWQTEETALRPR